MSVNGRMNSPHAESSEKVPNARTPGRTSGSAIFQNKVQRDIPSTSAAISISHERESKNPFISQIPNGSSSDALTRITPVKVSNNPRYIDRPGNERREMA